MRKRLWDVVLVPEAFSADDCTLILERMATEELEPATVESRAGVVPARRSNVRFVDYDPDVWIFQKLKQAVETVNPQTFRFTLNSWFDEGFQFTQYPEGGYYNWHADIGAGPAETRKLAIVVQLNEGYEGGELDFFPARFNIPQQRGLMALFPAYMPHRVMPVTKGTRYSLVTWVHGPTPFT